MKPIPDDVRRFILTSIPSVPYLEAALLFQRDPAARCTAAEVARALYLQERSASELLDALCEAGVLSVHTDAEPRYRYAPRDEPLALAIAQLAETYASDLVGVAKLIHDATHKNAHRFADAFKLRKDR